VYLTPSSPTVASGQHLLSRSVSLRASQNATLGSALGAQVCVLCACIVGACFVVISVRAQMQREIVMAQQTGHVAAALLPVRASARVCVCP
jgi:hypothetical protein